MSDYNDNPIRLSRFHVGLAIFYCIIGATLAWFGRESGHSLAWMSVVTPLVTLHTLLAYGARKRSEFSRKLSVVIGIMMLLAIPIGPIVALNFLPLTVWHSREDSPEQKGPDA